MRPIRSIVGLIIVATLAGQLLGALDAVSAPSRPVSLQAQTSKAAYRTGEQVVFSLLLSNKSPRTLQFSSLWDGNIQIISVWRDGVQLRGQTRFKSYEAPLPSLLKQSLTSRRRIDFGHQSESDATSNQSIYSVKSEQSGTNRMTLYALSTPGRYRVEFVYKYGGSAEPGVFSAESSHAVANFTILP